MVVHPSAPGQRELDGVIGPSDDRQRIHEDPRPARRVRPAAPPHANARRRKPQAAILRSIELPGTAIAPAVKAELAKRKVRA
jgi:hypothetical protein